MCGSKVAVQQQERALALRRQELGPDHPDTVGIMNDLGIVLHTQGKYQEAQKLFARSGQLDSGWRALLVAARAAVLTGNKSAARDYGLQSDSLCAGLEQKWGKDAYASYLRRPDIQNYRSQLAQVLTLGK